MALLRLMMVYLLLGATAMASEAASIVYVGTDPGHGGKGIYSFRFDPSTGALTPLGLAAETPNPSFLALDAHRHVLYAVNEIENFQGKPVGAVSAFSIGKDGKLTLLNQVSSGDAGPAHVSFDRTKNYLFATNYPNGSVAAFRLESDGRLGEMTGFVQHHGFGPNKQRQESAHAHAVEMSMDNRFALVADLGLDQIFIYPFDAAKGNFGEPQIVKTKPASGPRHLVFSADGKYLYVLNELDSTMSVYAFNAANGNISEVQTISALSRDFHGQSFASEIALHPSGKFFYASNRGEDSIAVFSIDPASGKLTLLENTPSGGKIPRHFALDPTGSWLLAGNQLSANLTMFHINKKTGKLTQTGTPVSLPGPVCIVFSSR